VQKLAEVCIKRPVFATMLVMALVVVGAASWFRLGVDRFPAVDLPTVTVRVELPGASTEEVETQVSQKIEEQVNTIQGIQELRSISSPGNSIIIITFVLSRPIDVAAQDVRDKVSIARRNLPRDIREPIISKTDNGVVFSEDPRSTTSNFTKSKLTASYINASLVPVIDFGRGGRKTTIFDGSRVDFSSRGNHSSSFRIGLGPYVGYRIESHSKQVYESNGEQHKDHNSDNFYLNNLRYGVRLQVGFSDVDLFFNYDLNNLFIDTKGPDPTKKMNAFSFGVTF